MIEMEATRPGVGHGDRIHVHPSQVENMTRRGWTVVPQPPPAPPAPADQPDEPAPAARRKRKRETSQ